MIKTTSKLILCLCLTFGAVTATYASDPAESIENEVGAVNIEVNQSKVKVTGAQGQTLEIYKITGLHIEKIKIDSNDKTVDLGNLQKGCYILKVGKVVRKISIK